MLMGVLDHVQENVQAQDEYNEGDAIPYIPRSPARIAGYLEGLELVDPGVVPVTRRRPTVAGDTEPTEVDQYGGVGRKA